MTVYKTITPEVIPQPYNTTAEWRKNIEHCMPAGVTEVIIGDKVIFDNMVISITTAVQG